MRCIILDEYECLQNDEEQEVDQDVLVIYKWKRTLVLPWAAGVV